MSALAMQADPAQDIELELPWPPSVNRYWRSITIGGSARTLLSREGRAYQQAVLERVPLAARRKLAGRLMVTITASPPDRRRRDLDNLQKATLDSLAHAGVYVDDSQIDYLAIERGELCAGGRLRIVVREVAL